MKKTRKLLKILILLILIFNSITSFSTVCADDVDEEIEEDENTLSEFQNEIIETVSTINQVPTLNSRRCVVYDRISGTMLYGKNEDVKGAMASTTKIMTATVILENANLDDEVIVSSKAAGTGGSRLGLKKGDKITVRNLLYGLMLVSGNDAAVALAEHVGGGVQGFGEMMNNKAKELGLTSTSFETPHGLDSSNHYTTAYELAKLADYAMKNELFQKIVGTKSTTIYINGYPKQLNNTNELLGALNGVVGIKTGFTNGAGRCLVTETKRGDMDIIVVVLGADTKNDRTKDSIKLIEYTYKNFSMVNLENKINEKFEEWKNINLKRIQIVKGVTPYLEVSLGDIAIKNMAVNTSDIDKIEYEINTITSMEAPISSETKIGTIILKLNNEIIESVDILTSIEIQKKTWQDYFIELLDKFRWQVLEYI